MRIEQRVLAMLMTVVVDGNLTRMPQLERKDYVKVNKVLELLGGKWNRQAKAHVFEDDPGDRLNDAVTTGDIIDPKKEFQFFETPRELAEKMVSMAGIGKGHKVLEPSAGNGAILERIEAMAPFRGETVAVELDKTRIQALAKRFTDAEVINTDFLTLTDRPGFDRIVMNPPFRKGQDIAHVRHAYNQCLAPGGRLVAITSPGWTFREDTKHREFRKWLLNEVRSHGDPLPEGTFKSSGTMVNTILVSIDKPYSAPSPG